MRILLIGAAVFLAAWFTVLKPGGAAEDIPAVTPANTTTTAPAADGTVNAAATPGAVEDTTVAATAIPAEVLAKFPKDVAKAIKAGKTLVLGVFADDGTNYRPMADDDRYVRNALKRTNRYKGQVFAKNISVEDLVDYAALVNDLGVKQSPAVVVIDRDLKGTVLTGYVDRIAINQAIADARRASIDPYITDSYLQQANEVCARFKLRFSRLSYPTIRGQKARDAAMDRIVAVGREYLKAVRSVPASVKWKGLKAHWLRAIVDDKTTAEKMVKSIKDEDLAGVLAAYRGFDFESAGRLDRRFDRAGLTSCAQHRRS